MSNTKTLAQKIAAASTAVGALATDKHNPQGNYAYISADKILERAGDALADQGVAVIPGVSSIDVNLGTTAKGSPRFDVTVHFCMIITDGETTLEQVWVGMGSDYSVPDKALYKGITSGHKYFLAKLLNIGVGNEEGEHETHTDPAAKSQPARKQAKPANGNGNGRHPEESFDNPWDGDDEPAKPKATPAQLAEIDELGRQVYADEWSANIARLAQWASTGNASRLEDLLDTEAHKAMAGLKKKLPESEPA